MTVFRMRFACGMIWVMGFSLAGAGEPAPLRGALTYPARGNFSLQAGTVEAWVRYDGDLEQERAQYSRYTVFDYSDPGGRLSMTLLFTGNDLRGGQPGYLFEIRANDEDGAPLRRAGGRWKLVPQIRAPLADPSRFHHVAIGWDFETLEIWIALHGERVETGAIDTPVREAMQASSIRGEIGFGRGGPHAPAALIVIDDLRISDRSRPADQLGGTVDGPLRLDPYTLLLDALDEAFIPDDETETTARYLSGYGGERGGLVTGGARFVPAVYGPGLQLYSFP